MELSRAVDLEKKAYRIRIYILDSLYHAKCRCASELLSITDILTYLYFEGISMRLNDPAWEERDRIVLSKEYSIPAFNAALALKGSFPEQKLIFLRNHDILNKDPAMINIPGVDIKTESLGQGISDASDLASDAKMQKKSCRVYCILSEEDLEDDQIKKPALSAVHHKLDNLCVFLCGNSLQMKGSMDTAAKFESWGFHVLKINSHNFDDIEYAFHNAIAVNDKPTVVILNAVIGKGISFMENQASWYDAILNKEQYVQARIELENHLIELLDRERRLCLSCKVHAF
jgi:transketolase